MTHARPAHRLLPVAFGLATLALAPAAYADDTAGASGRVVNVTINTPRSDDYAAFHGSVTLREGKKGPLREYKWGGAACPGGTLDQGTVDLLTRWFSVFAPITPKFKNGQGGARCLVAFELGRPSGGPSDDAQD